MNAENLLKKGVRLEVTKQLFEGHEGDVFEIHDASDSTIALSLVQIDSPDERILEQAREMGVREPFSLLFTGPSESFLEQHMYALHHPELGRLDMFLVPVGQDDKGYQYEAVFG